MRQRVFLILLGGAALFFGTANPIVHLPLLIIFYPAALYAIGLSSPHPFRDGWWAGLLGASAALYWISVAVYYYGEFPWPLAIPCSVLLGMYVGLWGGFFARLIAALRSLPPWRRCLAAALSWYLLEWLRGWVLTGFPWLTLSSGQSAWPALIQGVAFIGEYGLSGLLAGIGCLLAEAARPWHHWDCRPKDATPATRHGLRFGLAGLVLAACIPLFGVWRMGSYTEQGDAFTLSLIQGNLRQDVKWEPSMQRYTVGVYLELSQAALDTFRLDAARTERSAPDALIWPETSMPFYYQNGGALAVDIQTLARENGVPIIFGVPGYARLADDTAELFNRAYFVDKDGRDAAWYDKEHLVPFGEYVPPFLDFPFLEPLLQGVGAFTPGRRAPLFELKKSGGTPDGGVARLGMLICYEAIFPELARQRVADGATVLVNISNDAWYNRTSAPVQHLYLSVLRAVEQGRWMARCTNTGVTAFVSPLGEISPLGGVTDGSGLFISGFLTQKVISSDAHTLYFHMHPWLPLLAFPALLLIVGAKRTWRRKPQPSATAL